MNKKYVVRLSDSERGVCQEIIKNLRGYPRCFSRNYKGLHRISTHRCVVLLLEFHRTTASGHIKHKT